MLYLYGLPIPRQCLHTMCELESCSRGGAAKIWKRQFGCEVMGQGKEVQIGSW